MKKINHKIYFLLMLFWLSALSSCSKFLDATPDDFLSPDTYYSTEQQMQAALTTVYRTLSHGDTYGNFMLGRMGLEADEGWFRQGGSVGVERYMTYPTDIRITNLWQRFYEGINRANNILANIDKPVMGEDNRRAIKGETLFLRSYFYLVLVSNFGGVPLKLTPSITPTETRFPRSSEKEVYEQIIKDMTEAEGLVKPITEIGFSGRVSKTAVQGILARVCLYMAGEPVKDISKYKEARDWAKKVIESGVHKLNPSYSQVFINHARDIYDIEESIWEVEFLGHNEGAHQVAGLVGSNLGILNANNNTIGLAQGFIYAARWLYMSYENGDLRRDWNIAPYRYVVTNGVTSGIETPWPSTTRLTRSVGKWRRTNELPSSLRNTFLTPQNFPLLRYSDILLMFAEAENEVESTPSIAVYEALNQVRRRAFGKPVTTVDNSLDLKNMDQDAVRAYIQLERARELCFENVRKRDISRWGIFLQRMQVGISDFQAELPTNVGVNYYSNATARDVIWPIPSAEINLNRAITQNEGW